jgi:hypothetical protein
MVFTTGNDGTVSYDVKDITGKTIYRNSAVYAPNTVIQQDIEANVFPSSGLYLVTVTISNKTVTQKLLVEKN